MDEHGDMKPEHGFFNRETSVPADSAKVLNFVLSAPQVSDEARSGYACYKLAAQGKDASQVVG